MRRTWLVIMLLALAAANAFAAGPYYARGSFYAGGGGTWNADAGNQLFDDGLHGDGAAGDDVYAATITPDQAPGLHQFKVANFDWTQNWPLHPVYSMENAQLVYTTPGEPVFVRLDLRTLTGWQPAAGAVMCDHAVPAGTTFELMGSATELGGWTTPVPLYDDNGVWTAVVHVATPGSYEFKVRGAGSWAFPFGMHYNMGAGDNFTFATTDPNSAVRFLFNTHDGRAWAQPFDETPARPASWGRIKSLFR